MLSGCLQRAVCSDPLSSDIREKSDGPITSAGSAFRNFVLDRASYDETHGTEYTDADSSRPPPSSSSSKYPQTKAAAADIGEHASEPIRTNSETESTASSKYAKRYVPACRAFLTNFTSLIFERERGSVIIRRRSACPFLGPCTLPIQPTQRPVRTIPFRPSAAASVSARHFAPAHGYPQAIPNAPSTCSSGTRRPPRQKTAKRTRHSGYYPHAGPYRLRSAAPNPSQTTEGRIDD